MNKFKSLVAALEQARKRFKNQKKIVPLRKITPRIL